MALFYWGFQRLLSRKLQKLPPSLECHAPFVLFKTDYPYYYRKSQDLNLWNIEWRIRPIV